MVLGVWLFGLSRCVFVVVVLVRISCFVMVVMFVWVFDLSDLRCVWRLFFFICWDFVFLLVWWCLSGWVSCMFCVGLRRRCGGVFFIVVLICVGRCWCCGWMGVCWLR